jgi:hypothetical protein
MMMMMRRRLRVVFAYWWGDRGMRERWEGGEEVEGECIYLHLKSDEKSDEKRERGEKGEGIGDSGEEYIPICNAESPFFRVWCLVLGACLPSYLVE